MLPWHMPGKHDGDTVGSFSAFFFVASGKTENRVFHKNLFFQYFNWNWGGLGVSRVTARTVRRHKHKFSRDLVLHGIRKSTFRKYWNFNVLEMALKTLIACQATASTLIAFNNPDLDTIGGPVVVV